MTKDTFGIENSIFTRKKFLCSLTRTKIATRICSTLSASANHNYKTQRFSPGGEAGMSVIFDDKILIPKSLNHLAFVACQHNQVFPLYDSANEGGESRFLEEISNFEAQILQECFKLDRDLQKNFGGWTGEMIITGENSEIIYHEYAF